MKRDHIYLYDILKACELVEQFMHEGERDIRTNLAIQKLVENMGEAANKLSDSVKLAHPDIPWRAMIDTRNRIIHNYYGVDAAFIWDLAEHHIVGLKASIAAIMQHMEDAR